MWSDCRSVGIVRSRTQTMEFSLGNWCVLISVLSFRCFLTLFLFLCRFCSIVTVTGLFCLNCCIFCRASWIWYQPIPRFRPKQHKHTGLIYCTALLHFTYWKCRRLILWYFPHRPKRGTGLGSNLGSQSLKVQNCTRRRIWANFPCLKNESRLTRSTFCLCVCM
jgi:hypothetical protein